MTCLVILLLGTTGCGPTAQQAGRTGASRADDAIRALDNALNGNRSTDDLLRQGDDLADLPRGKFTEEQWAARNRLLQSTDQAIMSQSVTRVDATVSAARATAAQDAAQIAPAVAAPGAAADAPFMADLAAVTEEAIVEVACGLILDTLAPEEQPAEPGLGADVADAAQGAITKLVARRWQLQTFQHLVDWANYTQSVAEDADQFAQASGGYSAETIDLLARPEVRQAVVVYLRTCYSPPRRP